ncbi:MchC protein [Photobacterium frigidiphilum]|uniref:MchC protein n=1 Tax=Photobacterium frigidiphilum TaxID=264736 RepID=A0A2T3JEJ9_9GAMM|nr:MchC protein [Photobacterium frigidiphilum]PSU47329.1 MchC protein [Photobacterium frigidiphilum]
MMNICTHKFPNINNTVLFEKELPNISFVPFDAYKLKNAELIWFNKKLVKELGMSVKNAGKEIIDNYAYVSDGYTNTRNIDNLDKKIFLADRYGSRYEVCNGGSARCGINGNFQIKGIGANPLVAINIDEHHSHGKLCLSEAVNEAIWGEVCHQHLPHGAVRTLAIINTHTTVRSFYGLNETKVLPCALAIRQVAVRPAHFERSTFFFPDVAYQELRDNDCERVRQTISFLPKLFKLDCNSKNESIYDVLITFTEKLAEQIAVSRIQGIPHRSLTSSNVCVDGRFVDFGTITALPDFSNHIFGSEQFGVWNDHLLIIKWLNHLTLFINKYSDEKIDNEKFNHIKENFINKLNTTENIELSRALRLKGVNFNTIQSIKQELCKNGKFIKTFDGRADKDLLGEIEQAASKFGIKTTSDINFPLRKSKYSQKEIINNTLRKTAGRSIKNKDIVEYIDSYIK